MVFTIVRGVLAHLSFEAAGEIVLIAEARLLADLLFLRASMDYEKTYQEYTVNDRDFCYAVAKGCTEAIKEVGFYGYRYSTESEPIQDPSAIVLKSIRIREYGGS